MTLKFLETKSNPYIFLDFDNNIFKIKGNSYNNNYLIVEKIIPLFENPENFANMPISFSVNINYINSRTRNQLVTLFHKLKKLEQELDIDFEWSYDHRDDDMEEFIDMVSEITKLNITKVKIG